jgi:hypothetical protein
MASANHQADNNAGVAGGEPHDHVSQSLVSKKPNSDHARAYHRPSAGKGAGATQRSVGGLIELRGVSLVPSPALLHCLTQVLSAFKAVSADANVEYAAPTTFTVPPAAGWVSMI